MRQIAWRQIESRQIESRKNESRQIDSIQIHYSSSHCSALLLTRNHLFPPLLITWFCTITQSPLLFIIGWFSPLTKQIPSVSFVIYNHMVQPSH